MIPASTIEEIRNKADIVAIISEHTPLKKKGKNYLGLCPFHSEKKPSFTVSPEKQLFHCFGCGEGGNVFAFLMKIENISFIEAAEALGERLGITVEKTWEKGISQSERDEYYEITHQASLYFQETLHSPAGERARKYLEQRGLGPKDTQYFKLGYALDSWDSLFKYLTKKGIDKRKIEKGGLIIPREFGDGYYDRFRGRVIFPILDLKDREIAFGGRALGTAEPKYINSPDSPIYNKGSCLYGLNFSKGDIKEQGKIILVEGYFDLITPFQAGVRNIAATLGTALTQNQAKLLARFSQNVVLAFDADAAGGAATERSVEILKEAGLSVKTAILSDGKDPDEFVRKHGGPAFKDLAEKAMPWLEYKIKMALKRYPLDEIEGRAKATREVASILNREKDSFVQKEYIKMAAELLKVEAETILAEVKKINYAGSGKGIHFLKRTTEKPASKILQAEQDLLRMALEKKEVLERLKEEMHYLEFTDPSLRLIAELLLSVEIQEPEKLTHFLIENLPDEEAKKSVSRLLMGEFVAIDEERIVKDCIQTIKAHHLRRKLEKLRTQIWEAEKLGAQEKLPGLQQEFNEVLAQVRQLEVKSLN